jgi:hypothetical protein
MDSKWAAVLQLHALGPDRRQHVPRSARYPAGGSIAEGGVEKYLVHGADHVARERVEDRRRC